MKSDNNRKAALSALEGSQPKELTDEEIERVTSSRYPDKDLSALSGQIARWKREAMAISLRHARDHGHLSPQPSEELAASLPVSEGLQARLDRANRLLIQQKEQHPKEQGAEPYAWTVSGTRQMYFGEYAESDARMEAKKIGGTAVAFPLFRQEQGAEPVGRKCEGRLPMNRFRYMVLMSGGIGPDVWDKEIAIEANDLLQAAYVAHAAACECGGWVVHIEQDDELKTTDVSAPLVTAPTAREKAMEEAIDKLLPLAQRIQAACEDGDVLNYDNEYDQRDAIEYEKVITEAIAAKSTK